MGIATLYNFFLDIVQISICVQTTELILVIKLMKKGMPTLQLQLDNNTNINLCIDNGDTPLHIAWESEHDSTV